MAEHSIVISKNAPEGSDCEVCGKPANWQMYCQDCGHILRFYCDEHAFLSQADEKLEKQVKKLGNKVHTPEYEKKVKIAQDRWKLYINNNK